MLPSPRTECASVEQTMGTPASTARRAGVGTRQAADVGRVVTDREVLVAAATCRHGHLLDRRLAVRPRRVTVQVASDLAGLDERWRLALERALPQLRRAPWQAESR